MEITFVEGIINASMIQLRVKTRTRINKCMAHLKPFSPSIIDAGENTFQILCNSDDAFVIGSVNTDQNGQTTKEVAIAGRF